MRTVGFATAVVASVLVASTACATGDPAPLPDSDQRVSSDAPLTAAQAMSVRTSGRQLVADFLDRLPAADNGVDTDRSTERWTSCTARQKSFSFHPTINGVFYRATIFLGTTNILGTDEMHAMFRDVGATWDRDDGERGTKGVFAVQLNAGELPLGVTVSSPCYFVRDADGLSAEEIDRVAGFNSREWEK